MQTLISENASLDKLEEQAKSDGMVSLLESGLRKVKDGVTTLEEVLKVATE
jgi:type II secretory ATPase GspE/PulE/Tfp pilus assembly ATPase PilB-like protein